MRTGGGRSVEVLLGASLAVLLVTSTGRADEAPVYGGSSFNTVLFGSLDAGRSAFFSAGVKRSLAGSLDESGPVLLAGVGGGGSPEDPQAGSLQSSSIRPAAQGSVLLGYQWTHGPVTFSGLIGPEIDSERQSNGVSDWFRTRLGIRGHAELWAHPTSETLLTATAIAGSAREHVWARTSAGYAFWKDIFIGPELALYRTSDYREWRVGAHVTGLTWGRWNLRLSGGALRTDEDRTGAYLGVTAYVKM